MALFMKQEFTPPLLSRKWFAIKCRPNMQLYSRQHVISILESGLLFREDSIEVEQECPSAEDVWRVAGGGKKGWFTRGEKVAAAVAVSACVAIFPPRSFQRTTLLNLTAYMSMPLVVRACHRTACRHKELKALLTVMRNYLALARRAAACVKEFTALHAQLGSVASAINGMNTLLCRQQSELSTLMSRTSSALLGNAPWLRGDVSWHVVTREPEDALNLMKIHHAFLVVQSTLLKHIAMAHFVPSPHLQRLYKNHNERIYWIHTVLLRHLNTEFEQNYESLERMYRLFKNYGTRDANVNKKPGPAVFDRWLYSDVHGGVARTCLELKMALNKCTDLDMFLDNCALNAQKLDLEVLNNDIDDLIDVITKCLSTVQTSQMRLKKLQRKFNEVDEGKIEEEIEVESAGIAHIDERQIEPRDEVFYYMKTDEDCEVTESADVTTAPGKKERDNTEIVLKELKRKLVKREDLMRERERQALVKTMPQLKDKIPEFPRQMRMEDYAERKGYMCKLKPKSRRRRLFFKYRIERSSSAKRKKYTLETNEYDDENQIVRDHYVAKASLFLNVKLKQVLSFTVKNRVFVVTLWRKSVKSEKNQNESSDVSEISSDLEADVAKTNGKPMSDEINFKFSKKDLELSLSSSDSDFEDFKIQQEALLNDIRRHRVARKKSYPAKRLSGDKDNVDESLKPIEYSFGTGMAMASVLQVNSQAKFPNMVQEEVFMGDGEVSEDSGNDEDA